MTETYIFRPPRRWGLVYQLTAVLLLVIGGSLGLLAVSQATVGTAFLLFLFPAILAVGLGPVMLYSGYSLWSANYTLERDGIHMQWGLRAEDIPMDKVLWVRPEAYLRERLPVPRVRWPGAVLGRKLLHDGTPVEFFAARARKLLIIATPERMYAISPARPDEFLQAFQLLTEQGTISPVSARSVYPVFLFTRLSRDRQAYAMLLSGLVLSLGLLAWVAVTVSTRDTITWQFPTTQASQPVPAVRLFLLPVLNAIFFVTDALLGLFFYRRIETQVASYLLWGVALLTSLLFIGGVYFITRV